MTKQAELKRQAYDSTLKSRALSVLLYLIDRSNKELTCFPAIPTMAEQLHISVSTVKRALHELTEAGYIKKEFRFREKNRGQTSNLYTLVLLEDKSKLDGDAATGRTVGSDKAAEALQENKAGQIEGQIRHIGFDALMAEKRGDEEADEVQGDVNGCAAEERTCERGRGSVWHPLELLRLAVLEKRKKGIVNRLRNAEGVITGLILVDSS